MKIIYGVILLLTMIGAHAGSVTTKAKQSPAMIGNNNTVNYGYSAQDMEKIIAHYVEQHKLDNEQIKSLTAAIKALSQGKGVLGTESQIKAALDALAQNDTGKAKDLFKQEAQRAELAAKQGAEAYRNLGALAFLDNTQEALNAYRRATELDPDNSDGWNRLGHLLSRVGELDQAIMAYSKVLALGEGHSDKAEIAMAYGNLGSVYQTRGDLGKAIEFHQKALKLDEELGIKEGIAADYGNLGNIYKQKGNKAEAKAYYQKSIALFKYIGSPNAQKVQALFDAL